MIAAGEGEAVNHHSARRKGEEETVTFGQGDLVKFPEGLSCTWTVHGKVRKHYRFG